MSAKGCVSAQPIFLFWRICIQLAQEGVIQNSWGSRKKSRTTYDYSSGRKGYLERAA